MESYQERKEIAAIIQEQCTTIYNLLTNDLEVATKKSYASSGAAFAAREKMASGEDGPQSTTANEEELQSLYEAALADSLKEEQILREALASIHLIKAIKEGNCPLLQATGKGPKARAEKLMEIQIAALRLPMWRKIGERPPPLCGAIPAESFHVVYGVS